MPRKDPGSAIYSPLTLAFYDAWVLGISNRFAWRCPTRRVLLPFFAEHVRQRHLDIGVGTGYYLARSELPLDVNVTLMDLNRASLDVAYDRFGRAATTRLLHDAFEPLPNDSVYDSISLFYLLHCLAGPVSLKTTLFNHLKTSLSRDGVLFGATILGDEVAHNRFGRTLMSFYNRKGVFNNGGDTEAVITAALWENFERVDTCLEGCVLLFVAQRPRV